MLKGVAAAITHKSDAGLVILNLRDAAAVRAAASALTARADKLGVRLDGILVAQQITGGIETVLGISRDVEMGPVVMFGLGGIWLELFKDVASRRRRSIASRRSPWSTRRAPARLLAGFRGAPAGDLDALIDALSISAGSPATWAIHRSGRHQSVRGLRARRVRARWSGGAASRSRRPG